MIKYIETIEEFDKNVLKSDTAVLVDFFATWCGPCNMLSPILEKISKENSDVKFYKIDIDKLRDLAIDYEIEFVPTMLIIKNGKEVHRIDGFNDEKSIIKHIKMYM